MPAEEARAARHHHRRRRRSILPSGGRAPAAAGDDATVIAADGGVDRALALGLHVDLAIGDFDSVSPAGLAAAEAAGARVERHPAAKDATDLELALDAAIALGPARIVVVGSGGGRLDHLLGSRAAARRRALRGRRDRRVPRRARRSTSSAARARWRAHRATSSRCCPLHGAAEGVTTEGLEYPLRGRDAAARHEPRRLERVRRRRGPHHGRARLSCSPSAPARERGILVTICHKRGGARSRVARGRGRCAGCGGSADSGTQRRGRARHPRLLRDPEAGQGRVRAGERAEAPDPAGRATPARR